MSETCKHEWTKDRPNPPNFCPKCKGMYCEWVSFKDWDHDGEKWFKKEDVLSDGK